MRHPVETHAELLLLHCLHPALAAATLGGSSWSLLSGHSACCHTRHRVLLQCVSCKCSLQQKQSAARNFGRVQRVAGLTHCRSPSALLQASFWRTCSSPSPPYPMPWPQPSAPAPSTSSASHSAQPSTRWPTLCTRSSARQVCVHPAQTFHLLLPPA